VLIIGTAAEASAESVRRKLEHRTQVTGRHRLIQAEAYDRAVAAHA
jgi:hypothetical protein